jgi:catechol 2,3-dioxygenase-like lactoylglutathione lyase family enzyme
MINNIHKIAIATEDVEGSVKFYTETLGLELLKRFPAEGDEDFVFLKAGNIILELMPTKTMGAEAGFHHISFKVDNMDEAVGELAEKGVGLDVEPFDAGADGIFLAFFKGPNEVKLQLFDQQQ